MRLLVVEDDKISRNVLVNYLTKAGFNTESAANGRQALKLLDRSFFHIVLTDWVMPEIDGLQLCRLIRDRKTDNYIYIILVTAREQKADIVTGLEFGADDYLTKPFHPAELIARVKSGIRILQIEESLKKANDDIKRLSVTDNLTGCYNRSYLNERFPQELHRAQRYQHPLSVILTDIDHFKTVNDTHGHSTGDGVLKAFASCVNNQIRDTIDWMVRYGGEEFLIVLPDTPASGAYQLAERLRQTIERKAISIGDLTITITASFGGVSTLSKGSELENMTMDRMIQIADENLYQSKNNGRNQVCMAA